MFIYDIFNFLDQTNFSHKVNIHPYYAQYIINFIVFMIEIDSTYNLQLEYVY